MADRILRSAMVTVTYGGAEAPRTGARSGARGCTADTAESTEE